MRIRSAEKTVTHLWSYSQLQYAWKRPLPWKKQSWQLLTVAKQIKNAWTFIVLLIPSRHAFLHRNVLDCWFPFIFWRLRDWDLLVFWFLTFFWSLSSWTNVLYMLRFLWEKSNILLLPKSEICVCLIRVLEIRHNICLKGFRTLLR